MGEWSQSLFFDRLVSVSFCFLSHDELNESSLSKEMKMNYDGQEKNKTRVYKRMLDMNTALYFLSRMRQELENKKHRNPNQPFPSWDDDQEEEDAKIMKRRIEKENKRRNVISSRPEQVSQIMI